MFDQAEEQELPGIKSADAGIAIAGGDDEAAAGPEEGGRFSKQIGRMVQVLEDIDDDDEIE